MKNSVMNVFAFSMMNYLSDYMEQPQTKLFNETGVFFAFSMKQFNEQKKEGITYTPLDGGLICPKEHVTYLIERLDAIYKTAFEQDLKENGKEKIILRELYNHECFYMYDPTSAIEKLEDYPITPQEIQLLFNAHK